MLLAVDPGMRGCGCALFAHGILVDAAYIENGVAKGNHALEAATMAMAVEQWFDDHPVSEIVLEWPRIYATRIRQGDMDGQDPNDLLGLAAVDGALAANLCGMASVKCVVPSDWKGQMKKAACHARIRTRLSPAELAVMDAVKGAKAHNAFDAIGIGLHYLGRFEKNRVIPS